jgi:hypothetical protein
MFMLYISTKTPMPTPIFLLAIAMYPKIKENVHSTAILLLYTQCRTLTKFHGFPRCLRPQIALGPQSNCRWCLFALISSRVYIVGITDYMDAENNRLQDSFPSHKFHARLSEIRSEGLKAGMRERVSFSFGFLIDTF